jgi:ethanolamine utilization cobalamin adenosyltransferase
MGKVLFIQRSDIVQDSTDNDETLEYHVTGVCRKKVSDKMETFVTLTCVSNKRWTLKDAPLSMFRARLDLAEQVDHTLYPEVPEEVHTAVTARRLFSRRRLELSTIEETKEESKEEEPSQVCSTLDRVCISDDEDKQYI